jgi:hypothetical protein
MVTDPASAIKPEVPQLADLQIEALRQPSALTSSDPLDYRVRTERLTMLYQESDRMRRASFKEQLRTVT